MTRQKLRHPSENALPLNRMSLIPRQEFAWEPNWIDFRASRARIDRRAERGDLAARCPACLCEADVDPVPHSPRCTKAAR